MTERETPEGAATRPVRDLGVFAGPANGGGGSSFGAPAGGSAGAASGQIGGGSSTNGFGSAPAGSPFGSAPAGSPFGGPSQQVAHSAPPTGSASPTLRLVVGIVGVVVLAGVVLGGRFGWRHFVATPALPDTLLSMPRLTDPSFADGLREAQQSLDDELTAGSTAEVALYSDGRGLGLMLFALRGSSRPGDADDALTAAWTKSAHGKVQCFEQPAQAAAGMGVTFCVRGFFRRAVVVMAFGVTPPDPVMVARGTEEAWKAQ